MLENTPANTNVRMLLLVQVSDLWVHWRGQVKTFGPCASDSIIIWAYAPVYCYQYISK